MAVSFAEPIQPPNNERFRSLIESGRHQEAWDYLLCWSWLVRGDHRSVSLKYVFSRAGGQADGLKRCPQYMAGPTRAFVGNYLKELSNRLWDRYPAWDEPSLWRLVAALSRSNLDVHASHAAMEDAAVRSKQRKTAAANTASVAANLDRRNRVNSLASRGARRAGYR